MSDTHPVPCVTIEVEVPPPIVIEVLVAPEPPSEPIVIDVLQVGLQGPPGDGAGTRDFFAIYQIAKL